MAAGPLMYPGQNNTYVPDHRATNYLITQFSRNVKDFPLNKYVQYMQVTHDRGYYLKLNVEQAGRLKGGVLDAHLWPDGADRPITNDGTEAFNWVDYRALRYNFNFTLGWLSRDQAGFNLEDIELANQAQRAMTGRARRIHQVLENNSNWDSTHYSDVDAISGNTGRWDESTTTRMDIKRSINYAVDVIRKDTLSTVKSKDDMILVMNPKTAQAIGTSQEMINAIIQSPTAFGHWEGKPTTYGDYGLPPLLYGIEVVIEDTVMVTSNRGASSVTRTDVCADGTVYLLSRPGGLEARNNSASSFSTVMCFLREDMSVETLDDKDNRRMNGCIVDHTDEVMTAPVSGFRFDNVTS